MRQKLSKAFTLIELLIVIVIIGILATALVPRIQGMQNRARKVRVEKDFQDMRYVIYQAQVNTNKSLYQINGRTWGQATYLGCMYENTNPGGGFNWIDFRKLSDTSQCVQRYEASLRKIEAAAGMYSGALSYLERDPWGSPYIMSELEDVYGCSYGGDHIHSVGPDGRRNENGSNTSLPNDDFKILIPGYKCPGSGY